MVEVYRRIEQKPDERWSYVSIGGLGNWPPDVEYFSRVRQAGQECGAQVVANIPRDELKQWYARAQIFWHAAGYAVDETEHPELTEHFGISTVEAMAAGCVPVVMKKGGQPEIVEHGLNGFTWKTLDELKGYTQRLMSDADLRRRMSEAAQKRAQLFGREEFVNRVVRAGRGVGIDLAV
jgi:glycosyltransferase involved in cell wall biosynthesis